MSLKLYVWENVLYEYTPGIAFALAENIEQARKILLEKYGPEKGYRAEEFKKELEEENPSVHSKPVAFYRYGSA